MYSHSLVIGLDQSLQSGDLLLTDKFTPFNVETFELGQKSFPKKENYLIKEREKIAMQPQDKIIEIINTDRYRFFCSENPEKGDQIATPLKAEDFKPADVVVLNGLLDLKDPNRLVRCSLNIARL